jgi:predicted MFS family arabinose efflux permease
LQDGAHSSFSGTACVCAAIGFLIALPITTPDRIQWLLWAEIGFAALLCAVCCVDHMLYAASPPSPPSASAAAGRDVSSLLECLSLLRNPNFVVIALAYGLSLGTYSGWSGVLDPILAPLKFSQTTVNWLGFASTVGCVIGGVAFGNIGDHVKRVKLVLIFLFFASTLIVAWFTLNANSVLPRSNWQLFVSCTLGRCASFDFISSMGIATAASNWGCFQC